MTSGMRFTGSITALVTPFRAGAFDEEAFRRLLDWQIESGTHGFVPVGTTGEGPTLSHDEHRRVVEVCVAETKGRAKVIAGAGSNNTVEAIDLARHAEKVGADAVLVVTPYYNKPSQEGLYHHFKAVNDAIGIPIIIYNIPPRSVIDMSIDTMKRCFTSSRTSSASRTRQAISVARISLQRRASWARISCNCPATTSPRSSVHGGMARHGCISVVFERRRLACAPICRKPVSSNDFPRALNDAGSSWCRCMPRPFPGGRTSRVAKCSLGRCSAA